MHLLISERILELIKSLSRKKLSIKFSGVTGFSKTRDGTKKNMIEHLEDTYAVCAHHKIETQTFRCSLKKTIHKELP